VSSSIRVKISVLCFGNADRGDDAAGLPMARQLQQLGTEAWQNADEVILADTVVTGKRPGAVTVWDALASSLPGA